MKEINNTKLFLSSLRTAIIFVSSFIIYEMLLELEKIWNKEEPDKKIYNFNKRILYKFILILIIDLILVYTLFFLSGEYL
jgi:hypothetical protein